MPASGDASSTTKSAISPGTIIVGGKEVNPENLSRDTSGALNALGKIFDKKTVQEKQELANLFGQEAFNAIGDLALNQYKKALKEAAKYEEGTPEYKQAMGNANSWKDGGTNKILLHTIAGGILSSLAGNGFSSGAVSAGLNETIQKQLANIKDNGLHQLLSAAIGAAAAKIAGGDAQAGAVAALYGTKYNWLNHHQQEELVYQLSLATNDNDRAYILAKYQALSEYNIEKYGEQSEAIDPKVYDALSKLTYLSDGGLNYNLSVLTEKYGSNIDIERYKNELRTADGWIVSYNEHGKSWRVRTNPDGSTQVHPDDLAKYYEDQAWNQSVADNLVSKITMIIGVPGVGTTEMTVVKTADEVNKVFWSSGNVAKGAAEAWAKANGATTLEMTQNGIVLIERTSNMPWSEAKPLWSEASKDFAKTASGEVQVFQKAEGVSLESVWGTIEYKELMTNPNVTQITYNVIMSDGTTKIFTVVK